MLLILLSITAYGQPNSEALSSLMTRMNHAAGVDQLQGSPSTSLGQAEVWGNGIANDILMGQTALGVNASAPLLAQGMPYAAAWFLQQREARSSSLADPTYGGQLTLAAAEGDYTPFNNDGDELNGLVNLRAGGSAWMSLGRLHLSIGDSLAGLNFGTTEWELTSIAYSATIATPHFRVGFEQKSRWFGPGKYGSLLMTNNTAPLPAGVLAGDWRFGGWADKLGRFGAEVDIGWLPGDRRDLESPGWLVMDFRWAPIPWFEIGLSRNSIFGGFEDGELRPIDYGQLLLPTSPHVQEGTDINQELADTDERASYDVRLTLPVHHWFGGPVDYLEVYAQQGGEDLIKREVGPLIIPSLAGVANLYGAEISAAPLYAGIEYALIKDDLYRWYTGHRVYHDGWTHLGRSAGFPTGGDSSSLIVAVGAAPIRRFAAELRVGISERVFVADILGDHLFTFPYAEGRQTGTLLLTRFSKDGGSLSAEVSLSDIVHLDGIPNNNAIEHLVWLKWSSDLMRH